MSFFELNCSTNFSFLQAASHPHELVEQAAELGYAGLAICDECSLAGVVRAYSAAKELPLKLIIGARFKLHYDGQQQPLELLMLCPDRQAYAQLSALITRGRRNAPKGQYQLNLNDARQLVNRCLIIWLPPFDENEALAQAEAMQGIWSQQWIGYCRHLRDDDYSQYLHSLKLSEQFGWPLVAHNAVRMHTRKRFKLLQCLTAIQHNKPLQQLTTELPRNSECYLRPLKRLQQLYPAPLLQQTQVIAECCQFSLRELSYQYPDEILPAGRSASDYLRELTYAGARKRYPQGIPEKVDNLLQYELQVIRQLNYEHYFLTVYDIVAFARQQNILCQGRGSAANSAVCYCLFITEVDPAQSQLLFERFISPERDEPPDIDVDFEHQRREEVIQYIYKKYGRERAALAATVITYRSKSAIRDVGKALGLDEGLLAHLSRSLAWWDKPESLAEQCRAMELPLESRLLDDFLQLIHEIRGFPRHLSQHVGGFIISRGPMSQLVPVENASMPERTVIQWDKYDIETLGLLKIDILGLGMLSMIRQALEMTASYSTIKTLADIPKEDSATYDMLCRGDSIGVFQVESRAQMSMLPRLKPRCFYDLVIEIAIVRPGPIQGDMVHPYLKRRSGEQQVRYPNQAIRSVLERTLGVPIFQEQVIQLAMVAAGFSGGQADQLRRAMASWGRNGDLYRFKDRLIQGMRQRGYSEDYALRVFEQMKGFGSYGFPESHAASFAILAYFSAWLKRHHPAAFYAALLNSQPMGFYTPSQLIQDAQRHGIRVLPIDIDYSDWLTSLAWDDCENRQPPSAIRLGMHLIKGFNQAAAERLVTARSEKIFTSFNDVILRAQLNRAERNALARADALPRLAGHRHQAQWQALGVEQLKPLLAEQDAINRNNAVQLPAPNIVADMVADYESTGHSLKAHPLALLRQQGWLKHCRSAREIRQMRQGQWVQVAGIVTCRQRPGTAGGVMFLTLEDETGNSNIIVWRNVLERFRKPILTSRILLIKGHVEREQKVVHVVAGFIQDISEHMPHLKRTSRDFR